jgi:hypothetical protein
MAWKVGATLIITVTCECSKPRPIRNAMSAGGKRFALATFVRAGALTAGDRDEDGGTGAIGTRAIGLGRLGLNATGAVATR